MGWQSPLTELDGSKECWEIVKTLRFDLTGKCLFLNDFLIVFFPLLYSPLIPPFPHNHLTVVHAHESFFLFVQSLQDRYRFGMLLFRWSIKIIIKMKETQVKERPVSKMFTVWMLLAGWAWPRLLSFPGLSISSGNKYSLPSNKTRLPSHPHVLGRIIWDQTCWNACEAA